MLNSFSFALLIGMHVCPTWDEQFGRQRIRFRRTFSISEYPVPPYHLTTGIRLACIKQERLQLALVGTEAFYPVKTFANPMHLSVWIRCFLVGIWIWAGQSLFILQYTRKSLKCMCCDLWTLKKLDFMLYRVRYYGTVPGTYTLKMLLSDSDWAKIL